MEKIMNYEPRTLSFGDGLERGARSERERILALLDEHLRYVDMHNAGVINDYPDLTIKIALPDYELQEKK